jgi:hypothetical protein
VPDIYLATLDVKRDGADYLHLTTPLPETFSLTISSTFDRPLDQPLSDIKKGPLSKFSSMEKAAATMITGQTTKHKLLSGAVWVGGCYMQVQLDFVLHAYNSTRTDVMDKVIQLMALASPSENGPGGLLRPPGPTVANLDALFTGNPLNASIDSAVNIASNALQMGGDEIVLRLGKFFTMTPCIINSVTPTMDTILDSEGIPMSATVSVNFESYFTTTQEDLIKAFKSSISAGVS